MGRRVKITQTQATVYLAPTAGRRYLTRKAAANAEAREALDTVRRARELYEASGNDCWGLEDEVTRLHYLRLAAQSAETKSPA